MTPERIAELREAINPDAESVYKELLDAIEQERERCAKIAEAGVDHASTVRFACKYIAAAIRRGGKEDGK